MHNVYWDTLYRLGTSKLYINLPCSIVDVGMDVTFCAVVCFADVTTAVVVLCAEVCIVDMATGVVSSCALVCFVDMTIGLVSSSAVVCFVDMICLTKKKKRKYLVL